MTRGSAYRAVHSIGSTSATDMVAYESDGVFIQLWIGADDKLPRMARAVALDDPSQLRHQVEFSDWQLDVAVPPDAFASQKIASAARIPFARPGAGISEPDVSPPAQGESYKSGKEERQP